MRLLFSSTSGAGHWVPLLPVAHAALRAGHDVVFAVPEEVADRVGSHGVKVAAFGGRPERHPEQLELFRQAEETGDGMLARQAIGLGFGYFSPMAALPLLEETVTRFDPDVVLADPGEFGARTLARRDGRPLVAIRNGMTGAMNFLEKFLVAEPLARLHAELGLAALDLSPRLTLTRTPLTVDDGDDDTILRYRELTDRGSSSAPTGRPFVYATLGTVVVNEGGADALAHLVADAMVGVEADCLMTLGAEPDEVLDSVPANIELRRYADHSDVIPGSRVVITHGGSGTQVDALAAGRPMIVLPQFADQFHNAGRIEACGLGLALVGAAQNPDALRAAIVDALTGTFDDASARVADEIAALPTSDAVIADVVALATT